MAEEMIWSVSEANEFIKTLLGRVPQLRDIYIRGEISNYKCYPSGHHYFTLKDENCTMRCVMFRNAAVAHLRFKPENGMKVIAFGKIEVYPRDGAYQLICSQISADGIGDLHVAFEQLKAKLSAEGLFDQSHKKPLPRYPRRIAIITSSAGAAVHDMIRILRTRWPMSKVLLLPVRVQGEEAPPEIAGAIRYANKFQLADVIITGRGGGSIEDLWAFNDERVARAIYASEIPVISAVGHEPDVTISDFAADVRASTPSNAAEIVVPQQQEVIRMLLEQKNRMQKGTTRQFELWRDRLTQLSQKRVMTDPTAYFTERSLQLDSIGKRLAILAQDQVSGYQKKFASLCASLDALSPLKVLGRGYSMVRQTDGSVLRSANDVALNDRVQVILADGSLQCRVEEKQIGGE